ncbi:hypothetical protein N9V30_00555 [Candidatus Poseidoniales archaeon]|nr:hypothetical protein [Candidatus Poseidoniales archaeon]
MGKTDDHSFLLKAPEFLPLDLEELKKFHSRNSAGFNAMMCAYMEYFEDQLKSDVDTFLKSSKHHEEIASLLKAIHAEVANDTGAKFSQQSLGTSKFGDLEFRLSVYLEGEDMDSNLETEFLNHFGEVADDSSRVFFLRNTYGKGWKRHLQLSYTNLDSYPKPYWKWLVKDVKPETLLQFLGLEGDLDVSANRKYISGRIYWEKESDLWRLFDVLNYGLNLNLHPNSAKEEPMNSDEVLHAWIAFTASRQNRGKIQQRQQFVEMTYEIIENKNDSIFDIESFDLSRTRKTLIDWIAYGMDNYSEGKIPKECHAVAKEQVEQLILRGKELLSEKEFLRYLESGSPVDSLYKSFRQLCILVLIYEHKNKSGIDLLKANRPSSDQVLPNDIQMWAIKHHLIDDQRSMDKLIECVNDNSSGKIDSDKLKFLIERTESYNEEAIIEAIRIAFTNDLDCKKLNHLDKVKDGLFGLLKEEFP